jgi:hypothetical protein
MNINYEKILNRIGTVVCVLYIIGHFVDIVERMQKNEPLMILRTIWLAIIACILIKGIFRLIRKTIRWIGKRFKNAQVSKE